MTLSPLDDRYSSTTGPLARFFGDSSFIAYRIQVEVKWLKFLSRSGIIEPLDDIANDALDDICNDQLLWAVDCTREIEKLVRHDVKSIEMAIAGYLKKRGAERYQNYVHIMCTSEDICNVAYATMVRSGMAFLIDSLESVLKLLIEYSKSYADIPMMSRTHGQPASPTTVGKEFANFAYRLKTNLEELRSTKYYAKMNGAVGNYNAHKLAYPEVDWDMLSRLFITDLMLVQSPYTTQVEPHDWLAKLFHTLVRTNNILIDLSRDIWGYVSIGYLRQKVDIDQVGSSTMPHKINPINFENAEGNCGIANSLLIHLANDLVVSRWQRDLSGSTVKRNISVAFGHCLLAYENLVGGLVRVAPDQNVIDADADIDDAWELLAEAVQTLMRKEGIEKPYEKMKDFSRGQKVTKESLHQLIDSSELSQSSKDTLKNLKPRDYTGIASELAKNVADYQE